MSRNVNENVHFFQANHKYISLFLRANHIQCCNHSHYNIKRAYESQSQQLLHRKSLSEPITVAVASEEPIAAAVASEEPVRANDTGLEQYQHNKQGEHNDSDEISWQDGNMEQLRLKIKGNIVSRWYDCMHLK